MDFYEETFTALLDTFGWITYSFRVQNNKFLRSPL
jgi:hypothetical protein